MKLFRWFLINSLFAACLYWGFYVGVDGAKNVSIFYVWVAFALSLLSFSDEFVNHLKKKKPQVPRWLDYSFDLSVVFFLVWFGFIFSGIAYFIHLLLIQTAWNKALEDS